MTVGFRISCILGVYTIGVSRFSFSFFFFFFGKGSIAFAALINLDDLMIYDTPFDTSKVGLISYQQGR